jgi:teichoic acid transport system ATP-binding protein
MDNSIIKVSHLSKIYKMYNKPIDRLKESLNISHKVYYSIFHALEDITFDVNRGETIGIIGKNGSGKSTLLKILAGVLSTTSGNVEIKGTVSAILELGAGFNVEYSGMENIYLNGTILGKTKEQVDARLNDILEFADIGEFIHQPVKTYSSGMFARLAFAVAINVDPDILIVDEALAVGDMKFQARCFRKFEELKEKGTTILFVGHDVSSIRKFCEKALWLHQGKLIAFGDTLSVTAEYMEYMNSEQSTIKEHNEVDINKEDNNEVCEEFEPINRWGSCTGSISKVIVLNSKSKQSNVLEYGEKVRISVQFTVPEGADLRHFSTAIAIKNTMGLDLIVFTTKDDNEGFFCDVKADKIEVVFEFTNFLTDGEYVLVAALEDRSSIQPQYYDFIEGAAYLKSTTTDQFFGIVHPPCHVYMRRKSDNL